MDIHRIRLRRQVNTRVANVFRTVSYLVNFILPGVSVDDRVRVPYITEFYHRWQLRHFAHLIMFVNFRHLWDAAVLHYSLLAGISFHPFVRRVANRLIASKVVRPRYTHFHRVRVFQQLRRRQTRLVDAITNVYRAAFQRQIDRWGFQQTQKMAHLVRWFFRRN